MTGLAKKLFDEALTLPEDERADLAERLVESLPSDQEVTVRAAWGQEIGRRITAIDQGLVKAIPWEKAEPMIFGKLDEGT